MEQGGNVVNACKALGVEVIKCNCHRVNSATFWSLGVSGSAATCKNKATGDLMKKLAACVDVFSHCASINDKLKDTQRLEKDLQRVDDLIRRNDTRCFVINLQIANDKPPRVVSPDEVVDSLEVLPESLCGLQFVVVDRGVAQDADARCQFLHEVAHHFVLADSRRTRNPQTPQGRGVDAVAVAL